RGAGTLVANESIDRDVELTSLYDDLAASGRTPATKVIRNEVIHATDRVAEALQLPERALVNSLQRIRLADDEPIALMHNFLPAAPVHLSIEMLEEHGLYELLRASGIRMSSATQRMCAKNASAAEARTLGETRGAALLTMERIAYDDTGRPVEFGQHLYRASRYAFTTSWPRGESAGAPSSPPAPRAGPPPAGWWGLRPGRGGQDRPLIRLGRLVGLARPPGRLQLRHLGDRHVPPRLAAGRGHQRVGLDVHQDRARLVPGRLQ